MKYKFKIGDKVKVVDYGNGTNIREIGFITIITELGTYFSHPGYKVADPIGNSKTGEYGGFIGEEAFELVEQRYSMPNGSFNRSISGGSTGSDNAIRLDDPPEVIASKIIVDVESFMPVSIIQDQEQSIYNYDAPPKIIVLSDAEQIIRI